MQGLLIAYRENNRPIDLSLVLKNNWKIIPHFRHFDVARIIVDQTVRLAWQTMIYRVFIQIGKHFKTWRRSASACD